MYRTPFTILGPMLAGGAMLFAQATTPTVQGHVFSADGSPVATATVTLVGPSTFVEITDAGGHYLSPALPPGNYNITVNKDGFNAKLASPVTVTDSRVVDFVLDPVCNTCGANAIRRGWNQDFEGTFLVVVLFLASIWLVRWHNIARPNREMLVSEIDNAKVRFRSDTGIDLDTDARVTHLKKELAAAEEAIAPNFWRTILDFLFWSRGQEITGWSRVHEFQRDAIALLAKGSDEIVLARLQSAELDLLDIDKTHAKTIASNIKDALGVKDSNPEALRALLTEALTYLNDEDVNTFAQLVGWQTKAVWLAGVGCSLALVLAFAVGNPVLFIAGAAGGYLSRLARTLKRADIPTDYGASWTTLFLSPIVGALSGWFGILLVVVLADSKMQVLGAAFQSVKWSYPLAPFTLGMAFALGFSERLFDGIISQLEDKVDSDRVAATKPRQPTSGVKVDPKDGGEDNGTKAGTVTLVATKVETVRVTGTPAAEESTTIQAPAGPAPVVPPSGTDPGAKATPASDPAASSPKDGK